MAAEGKVNWASMGTKDYAAHRKKVHTVAWSCGGQKVATGSVDQAVRIWSIDESGNGKSAELMGHQDSVDQLRWDPCNPEVLCTASGDKTVRIWDARSNKQVHAVETRGENINVRWSPDSQHIAVGDKDDYISFVEMRKTKTLKSIKFTCEVNEMAWEKVHSHGRLFFLTTGNGTVEIYRYADLLKPAEPTPLHSLQAHTANCYCIDFDPKGEHFAVGGADALVTLWKVDELVCVNTCARLEWPVRTLSFSHDSRYIASGSEDAYIDIADVSTGQQVHQIAPTNAMNSIAWHPSKLLLAYAADDKDRTGRDDGSFRIFGFPST